jgi:DNA-binding transcriptional regulator YiaG
MDTVSHPNRSKVNRRHGQTPTPAEIRAARESAGKTQAQAAALVYGTVRTWEDWEGGRRRMPAAALELFMLKVGQMTIDQVLDDLGQPQ